MQLTALAGGPAAARAGTRTRWYTGDRASSLRGHANLRDTTARQANHRVAPGSFELWLDDGYAGLAPVGRYRPNAFGLHDMTGNVSEWCREWFQVYYCPVRPGTGERIPVDSGPMRRVQRGGSLGTPASSARVTARLHVTPTSAEMGVGLRPSRALQPH